MPLLRSRVGEAPDSTRALWHASRRQPTMEQMFLHLLLLRLLPLWGSSNATPALAFYFPLHAGSRLASLATCLLLRAPPMFSPKSSNRFVKVRIDQKNIDLLCSQVRCRHVLLFPGGSNVIAYVFPLPQKRTLPETLSNVCI